MKKILFTTFALCIGLFSQGQQTDSIRIITANERGIADTTIKVTSITGNSFKGENYYKGRLLVKFKPGVLNNQIIGDRQVHTDASKLLQQTPNLKPLQAELISGIKSFKPLTAFPMALKAKTTDSAFLNLEDVYRIMILYCEEGDEEQLAETLVKNGLAEYAEPDHIMYLDTPPNDPLYYLQRGWEQTIGILTQKQHGQPKQEVPV